MEPHFAKVVNSQILLLPPHPKISLAVSSCSVVVSQHKTQASNQSSGLLQWTASHNHASIYSMTWNKLSAYQKWNQDNMLCIITVADM